MHTALPTCRFDSWSVTSLRDSLITELAGDKESDLLQMFFYAITVSGWNEIRKAVMKWRRSKIQRSVTVYVGTDHAITDPAALELMQEQGVEVRLMNSYSGIFHPKLVWLKGESKNLIWIGSNNLTRDGLLNNIEFAVLVSARKVPSDMTRWASTVSSGSTLLNSELLRSYSNERKKFEEKRAGAKSTTFTWSRKHEPEKLPKVAVSKGDLILEIMPKETRGGNQIQVPKEATKEFFGLEETGGKKTITVSLRPKGEKKIRQLAMTVFQNDTIRLSINELEYRDRPCVIVFHKKRKPDVIEFEIVSESIFPTRYRSLIAMCTRKTRKGSRRWIIR